MCAQLFRCVQFFVIPWTVQPSRLHCPWYFSSMNTGMGCHFLLQGIFLTQGIEPKSPASPALAGGFFTTESPGKPQRTVYASTNWADYIHPNLDSAGMSVVSSNLESQLGKCLRWYVHPTSETSNCSFEGPCL